MHIVQILPELNEGGVERGTVELNRELVKRGHQSTVISAGGKLTAQIEKDGGRHITLDVCSKNPLTVPSRVFKLRKILRHLSQESGVRSQESGIKNQRSGVRISHISHSKSNLLQPSTPAPCPPPPAPCSLILHARSRVPAWLCYFANRKPRTPFVTTVHGFNRVSRYSEIMTRADAVICVSTALKEYIQNHYGTPNEKITVIHRGIDPEEFDPENLDRSWMDMFQTRHGLKGKYIVTSVGRITELKDYETFIRAVAACAGDLPNIKGLIVGGIRHDKQAYFDRLQTLVQELGLKGNIVFAGSQSHMPEIYALSRVLVSCSKQPEAFGRTLIEAMAMNTPVIAARHGGALDIIKDDSTGLLVAPGSSADELAAAMRKIQGFPSAGLRGYVVGRFTLDQMVEKTIRVYEQLIRTPKN